MSEEIRRYTRKGQSHVPVARHEFRITVPPNDRRLSPTSSNVVSDFKVVRLKAGCGSTMCVQCDVSADNEISLCRLARPFVFSSRLVFPTCTFKSGCPLLTLDVFSGSLASGRSMIAYLRLHQAVWRLYYFLLALNGCTKYGARSPTYGNKAVPLCDPAKWLAAVSGSTRPLRHYRFDLTLRLSVKYLFSHIIKL